MVRDFGGSFISFGRAQSAQIKETLMRLPFSAQAQARIAASARASIDEQKAIEAADTLPFEIFRQDYLDIRRLGV